MISERSFPLSHSFDSAEPRERDTTLIDFHVRLPRNTQEQLQKVKILSGMTIQEFVIKAIEDRIQIWHYEKRQQKMIADIERGELWDKL